MKNWLFFLSLLLLFNSAFGQNKSIIDSLKVVKETPYNTINTNTLNEIGLQHESQEKYHKVLVMLDSAYTLASSTNNKQQLMIIMTNQGIAYTRLEQHQKANELFKGAYEIATEIGSLYHQMELAGKLATNNERVKNFKKAASYYKIQTNLKDTIFKNDMKMAIAEKHTTYETQRILNEKLSEERKNAELQKENVIKDLKLLEERAANKNLVLWGGLSLGLVILLGLIYYLNTRVKEAKSKRDEETVHYRAVFEAEEKERSRIAKDLHDGLGQLLSTAKLNIAGLEDEVNEEDKILVQNSMNLIDEAVNEVRTISHNMMPAALMEYGLVSAIESFANTINESKALHVNFSHKGMDNRLEESKEIALYRVVQEVLNNMIKYAKADKITVTLNRINNKAHLLISDNGKGFDISTIHQSKGIGWQNVFSRISMINGEVDVISTEGKGTDIRIDVIL
ncbi:ATP-binding protein [Aquimarina megaterium]|uniref:ATP-binding protein n=1 Tax=Aquimarina megaterium TaxID=1443666 RepID=UPI00046F327A|nr:ATP-binding protein [Aquimarina megaterium]